ncbi:restriction endonuclease subunit S [Micromonospora sp. 4G57]|uniref:Restriction endonuclease subunit S n=1 Tax=Micromonospora sicca TaxID=2202420 RepID=A0ABU5J687_9ACTN|nr:MULTISPECIES: restriction endonuclease subunit S [unclassified Micromonospora]MDZ5443415.1 restriction endonuclease subunit S [Micromonospora sp. 4G57]MDZ5488085.1 restriction endonuclease subunit S [Micromonospora sp. 4G53]
MPIRYVAKLGTGHTPSRQKPEYWTDCDVPWVTLADVWQLRDGTLHHVHDTKEKISKLGLANSSAVRHSAGTVILSRTASVGFSAIMGKDMATSQDFATWTCNRELDPKFLLYVLRAMAPDLRRVAAGSTHKTVYMPDIEELRTPLPLLDEQRRIAAFLDAETARIWGLIGARQQQLKLLEERELSRVFNSIAGTEEPGARKSSGLRWLGDVPVDWPVLAVSTQYEVLLGKMLNQERARGEYLRPYLRNFNVQWDRIDAEDLLYMNFPPNERSRYEVRPGDLLICEGGQPGRSAIWDGTVSEIYYQKALHRARSRGRSSVRWLFYCLRAATALDVFSVEGNSTTIGHLTGEQLRAHRFPFPERRTQDRLVSQLEEAAEQAKRTGELLASQVELLAERRQALITAAVTGQIDVTAARGVDV